MTVVGITQGDRTYLDAVNRLLAMIGESEVATLMTPSRRVANAMRGVEDARDEIYYRTLWDFRRGFMSVPLVASTMWYELPVDYQEMAQFMSRNSNIAVIPYLSFDNMIQRWPELRLFPPGPAWEESSRRCRPQTRRPTSALRRSTRSGAATSG
jgi:hypothetical protein